MVPATLLLEMIGVLAVPEQTVCEDGVASATGVGFTNTVAVMKVPGQPLIDGMIVNVTTTGELVVFVKSQ